MDVRNKKVGQEEGREKKKKKKEVCVLLRPCLTVPFSLAPPPFFLVTFQTR